MTEAGFMAVLAVFLIIVAAFAAMILSAKRARDREFLKQVKESWGCAHPRHFLAEELDGLREYSDALSAGELPGRSAGEAAHGSDVAQEFAGKAAAHGSDVAQESAGKAAPDGRNMAQQPCGTAGIDDITAADTDLNLVFCAIAGGSFSSPGMELLFSWLRHPLISHAALRKRIEREDYFTQHEDVRNACARAFFEIGFLKGGSYFHYIRALNQAEPIGQGKFLLLGGLTLAAIVFLFINPIAALLALVPLLIADYRVHVAMKEKTGRTLMGFAAILRLMRGASQLLTVLPENHFSEERARLRTLLDVLSPVKRGSYLVASGGNVGTGLVDAVLEYVKLLFHVDLMRFDSMLAAVRDHEADVLALMELLGELDAALGAASYIASLPVSVRPELVPGTQAFIDIRDMGHPLLEKPVRNSIETDKSVLLTGSNASGKSTFLKGIALAAILAQSIGIVPASYYRAPFFRIFSSIALSDNLLGGESYFVVEIRSLKRIIDAVSMPGPPILAFVDEVLRGTNTIERIAASSQILRFLARPELLIFAATHDIELSYMLEGTLRNFHFQESTRGSDISFDFRLKEGRTRSGNALALLKANGYPEEVTEAAERTADTFVRSGEWELQT